MQCTLLNLLPFLARRHVSTKIMDLVTPTGSLPSPNTTETRLASPLFFLSILLRKYKDVRHPLRKHGKRKGESDRIWIEREESGRGRRLYKQFYEGLLDWDASGDAGCVGEHFRLAPRYAARLEEHD